MLDSISIAGKSTVHVNGQLYWEIVAYSVEAQSVYTNDPKLLRTQIEMDASSTNVTTLKYRREISAAMKG